MSMIEKLINEIDKTNWLVADAIWNDYCVALGVSDPDPWGRCVYVNPLPITMRGASGYSFSRYGNGSWAYRERFDVLENDPAMWSPGKKLEAWHGLPLV